jgi:hypothetical protein
MKLMAIVFAILSVVVGCHTSKQSESMQQVEAQDSAIVLSFYSRGAGIDSKAYQLLTDSMEAYTASYGDSLMHTKTRWGREGEIDICFPPQATSYYSAFYNFLKRDFAEHPNVHYTKALDCGKGEE